MKVETSSACLTTTVFSCCLRIDFLEKFIDIISYFPTRYRSILYTSTIKEHPLYSYHTQVLVLHTLRMCYPCIIPALESGNAGACLPACPLPLTNTQRSAYISPSFLQLFPPCYPEARATTRGATLSSYRDNR